MQTIDPESFYDEKFTAAYLGEAVSTTQKRRLTGTGPAFHKFGKLVRYQGKDILAHAKTCRRTSTSDTGKEAA